jgi:ParB-like chromosome segregation protein Spo0J
MEITWTEQKRKLKDLSVYERNPRRISKIAFEKLKESLRLSGYNSRLLINLDNTVVSGHQRIRALKELGVSEIDVLVPNRLLTPKEFERVLITSNISAGEFDMDLLANEFDADELIDWGMDETLFSVADSVQSPLEDEPAKDVCGYCGK